MQLFTSPKDPWKVVGDLDDAIRWTNEQLQMVGDRVDDNALKSACLTLMAGRAKRS